MTDLQCFEQAIKDYEELAQIVDGKDYEQIVAELKDKGHDIWYVDDELSDINYGTCCLTIRNECGKAKVLEGSIEVYNDSEDSCLGDYTLEELKAM